MDLPTGRVHMEHGHTYDKINWRSDLWEWAAGAAYTIESDAWPGIDEAASAVWNWLQDRKRMARVRGEDMLADWTVATKIKHIYPAVSAVVLGHSHLAGVLELPIVGVTYVNTGSWSRDPRGKSKMDVAVYDSAASPCWQIADARELI